MFPETSGIPWGKNRLERLKVSTASALGVPLVRANIESWQPTTGGISIVSFSNKTYALRFHSCTLEWLQKLWIILRRRYIVLWVGLWGEQFVPDEIEFSLSFLFPSSFLVHYSPLLTLFYLITCPRDLPFQESLWTHQLTKLVRLMFLLISCEFSIISMISWFCVKFSNIPWKNPTKTFKPWDLKHIKLRNANSGLRLEHEEASPIGGGLALPDLRRVSWNDGQKVNIHLGIS